MMLEVGAIMYGRTTYKFMEAYWPNATDNDPVVTERMNNLHKIVFSKSLASADWGETTLLREIVKDEIAQLKQQPGGDIVILGSGEIISTLTTLGLMDEYRLIISPVILGNGHTLFKGVTTRVGLQLVQTKMLGNGIQLQYYVPEKI
jgi:dihydrofolate reductase